ncbi:MAG: hypothetical protein LBH21_04280 [Gracilibacteraceae bacterium]|nr:hypothetical protein [Gracilibacteraceae bacterium]
MALGQPRKRGKLKSLILFVRQNKVWRIALPLALIPVLSLVLFWTLSEQTSVAGKENIPVLGASGNENLVEILPQPERDETADLSDALGEAADELGSALIETQSARLYPTKDPFADAELTNVNFMGAILSGNGTGVAMLQAGGTSYIVRTSDFVGKSAWQVFSLTADSVTLKNGAMTRVLYRETSDLSEIIK